MLSKERETILLVEKNPTPQADVERFLRREGYFVTTADSGHCALELLQREEPFHLLLASLATIEDQGEIAFIEAALAHSPTTPVILLADSSSINLALDGLAKGAYDYVLLPHHDIDLQASVRRGLEKRRLEMELQDRAYTDPLTGLANRSVFEQRLDEELHESLRYGTPLSLLFIDIDGFKSVNDEHGHRIGDLLLKAISELIKSNVRRVDLVARYGGDEFVVLMPQTNASSGYLLAERLRGLVKSFSFNAGDFSFKSTVSIGIASYPEVSVKDPEDFILAADMALLAAKRAGGNKILFGSKESKREE